MASDESLLLAVARDERSAFRELSERYAARLASFCGRCVKNESAGEDLAQDVLVAIWHARRSFVGGDAAAWIYTFAVNHCRKHRRSVARWLTARFRAQTLPIAVPRGPFEALEERQLVQRARLALAQLPDELREPVLLRLEGGLDYRSVGGVVGCSEGAARVRVFTALQRLRAAMGERA